MTMYYSFSDHHQEQLQQQSDDFYHQQPGNNQRYRLTRSPRFVKQLSDIRAAGRQQLLHMNDATRRSVVLASDAYSKRQPLQQPPPPQMPPQLLPQSTGGSAEHLLVMSSFPSPRSSSTATSTDNLNPVPNNKSQIPLIFHAPPPPLLPPLPPLPSKVQLPLRTSLANSRIANTSSNTANNSIYTNPVLSHSSQIAAISCLASPPWTRSTSPASTQSNQHSISPPVVLPVQHESPPSLVPSSCSLSPQPQPTVTVSQALPFRNDDFSNRQQVTLTAKKYYFTRQPQHQQPPAYSPSPLPAEKGTTPSMPPVRSVSPAKNQGGRANMTPCSLISTTNRPFNAKSRSRSMPSVAKPFCANEDEDEPFTLIPLPNVDPNRFPEQSWAYRNVRKLVSRLSAHVKERRRQALHRTMSNEHVVRSEVENADGNDRFAADDNNDNDDEPVKSGIKDELSEVSQLVREQFGGSLSSLLKTGKKRSSSSPPSHCQPKPRQVNFTANTSSKPGKVSIPVIRCAGAPSAQHRSHQMKVAKPPSPRLSDGSSPCSAYSNSSFVESRMVSTTFPVSSNATSPSNKTVCAAENRNYVDTGCHNNHGPSGCHYCAAHMAYPSTNNTPLSRYGLRGRHVHLPPEELDLTAPHCNDPSNIVEYEYDETDIPRSALSPQFGYADPIEDDMFRRSVKLSRHAVRF